MFLLKDRNTTYYARYCFSKDLVEIGFPAELRFSLNTKKRSDAIDRLMVIMSHIRGYVSAWESNGDISLTIQRLRSELKAIRQSNFCTLVHTSHQPVELVLPVKPSVSKHQINKRLLDEFIRSKEVEDILPRTIQQLQSRISAFIKFSKVNALEATTKHAMDFKDELLGSGKAEKSVVEYLAAARQFYKWLRLRGDLDKNIFDDVTVKRRSRRASEERQRWTKADLFRLFQHRSLNAPSKGVERTQSELEDYWVPLLLTYTGARVSEICQLDTGDLKLVGDVWCIDINDRGKDKRLKSASSKRLVPLHPKLIEKGFLRYAQNRYENKQQKLFSFKPIGTYKDWSKTFVNRFSKVLDDLGFVASYRPTLHSLRHTFVDELQQAGTPENVVADLVGHSKQNLTFDRYGKRIELATLERAVKQLNLL
ncbi:site-specific integrase [Vibrio fluvialis]|uniref:site-specific integrase n=1 Tax=Vibrio fluvialis TaxID=676 RepID=UPI001EEB44B6|nr:site-specific integrase [Vibrio fluvialis]MCG6398904.1 tyrosine-type recombinase/integrase [Vibrio fluvialis]